MTSVSNARNVPSRSVTVFGLTMWLLGGSILPSGTNLMTGAPAPVDAAQLRELGVAIHRDKLAGH